MQQLLPYGSECWQCDCEVATVTPGTEVNPIYGGPDDPNDLYPLGPQYPLLWAYYEQTTVDGVSFTMWKWNPALVPNRWA